MRERNLGGPDDPVSNYGGITDFESLNEVPHGRFTVSDGGMPIDFLHEYKGSKTTIVCFHGAVSPSVVMPVFTGRNVVGDSEANLLTVSDPTLTLSRDMTISWFVGSSRQYDLQGLIRRTIEVTMALSGVEHLIFLGSSGGGFAALDMSRRFPGSLALPMNPQTSVGAHRVGPISRWLKAAWPDAAELSDLPRWAVHDQVTAYSGGSGNTVGYIQNARDLPHIKHHMTPFMEAAGELANVWLLSEAWGDPAKNCHVPPPRPWIAEAVARFVRAEGVWDPVLEDLTFTRSPRSMLARWDLSEVGWGAAEGT